MSDDLIKRLLAEETDLTDCAVDRIEELQILVRLTDEIKCSYEKDADQMRIKLAKAVEALRFYAVFYKDPFGNRARATLAELEKTE